MTILFRHEAKIQHERKLRKRGSKVSSFFFDLFINLPVGWAIKYFLQNVWEIFRAQEPAELSGNELFLYPLQNEVLIFTQFILNFSQINYLQTCMGKSKETRRDNLCYIPPREYLRIKS